MLFQPMNFILVDIQSKSQLHRANASLPFHSHIQSLTFQKRVLDLSRHFLVMKSAMKF